MTETNNGMEAASIEALGEVLDRYGSDRTRWPAPVRRRFAGLIAGSEEAGRRLREAEALDRLLDLAPEPEIDNSALAERIMAAADAEAGVRPRREKRAPWSVFNGGVLTRAAESSWQAGALLAASLVLGAVFGLTGTLVPEGETTQMATYETEIDPGQIALDSDSLFEEDFL
jgi:hypothetical protein